MEWTPPAYAHHRPGSNCLVKAKARRVGVEQTTIAVDMQSPLDLAIGSSSGA